jgi:hypothetical protein
VKLKGLIFPVISGGIPTRYHKIIFFGQEREVNALLQGNGALEGGIPEIINRPLGSVSGSHLFWEHPFAW